MRIFFFILLVCYGFSVQAQTRFQLNENSVVKDTAGTVYPASIWQALLMKGYSLKPVDPKNPATEFLLVKLTDKQQQERLAKAPKPRESAFFKTGEKLSLFNTTDINNNKINLKNATGKIIVLNFWFINCGPCRREIPDLNELVDSFKNNDKVQFVAVALDDKGSIEEFLKLLPFKYTIVDNGRFIADKYGVRSFPTHVIINTDGKVYFHTTGLTTNTVYWLHKTIKELLEQDAANKTTP